MGKVFTITDGLENTGALKTGGQGSVYRGRRIGEIITAIKLLPTPIYSESKEDKNYRDFQNEVEKLKKVNNTPNPNVVKILSSGLSETGNFPFIEMEFIDGPDLEELLRPPHDAVFTIKEVIKVAEQLSNALAHCHKLDVKHGDVKSNNVKYNTGSCNYILLDFGLAVMSNEERRTSLRRAGAVEFMAPEQNEGDLLFQTDVYSFGVILFELLAGRVPFPLVDKTETARNSVRLSHIETPAPDVLDIRKGNLPAKWPIEKKEREMMVPVWLTDMIYKCLQKKPSDRFNDGVALHEYITNNSSHSLPAILEGVEPANLIAAQEKTDKLEKENQYLQKQLASYTTQLRQKDNEIAELQKAKSRNVTNTPVQQSIIETNDENVVSKKTFYGTLAATILLAVVCLFLLFRNGSNEPRTLSSVADENKTDTTGLITNPGTTTTPGTTNPATANQVGDTAPLTNKTNKGKPIDPRTQLPKPVPNNGNPQQEVDDNAPADQPQDEPLTEEEEENRKKPRKYKPVDIAHFYKQPNEASKTKAFINKWNGVVTAQQEKNDFVYIVYTNEEGVTTKGWLRKNDLYLVRN